MVTSSAVVGSSAISSCGRQAIAMAMQHALTHAARQLMRVVVEARSGVRDAHRLEQFDRARSRASASARNAVDLQRLDDLSADRVHRVERRHRFLEDEADLRRRARSASRVR